MGVKRRPANRGTSSQGKDTGGNRSKKSRQSKKFHGRNGEIMANKVTETREDDVFEADEVDADEDLHASRYDDVENYEYELPEDFEDEEIDEDEAFNSEDERLYGHLFASSNKYPSCSSSEEETDVSDGEDNVREAFNALQSSSDEEDGDAWPEEINDDAGMGLPAEFSEELDGDIMGKGATCESSEEELPEDEEGQETGRRRQQVLQTEAFPESVFHVSSRGEKLSVMDLIDSLGSSRSKLGAARKSLERLTKKAAPVEAPLPGPIRERQERKAAYDESKKDIQKWMQLVKAHRETPTLKLTSSKIEVPKTNTVAAVAAKHKADNKMELEVAAMLEAAGAHSAAAVAESEEALAMRMLNAEEAKARREELAKMRALLFYHEVKAKRLKKIKSKEYRRRLKRADKKKSNGESDMMLLGDEELRQQREEAEYERAKERLTLKHKNTSRFIRRAIKRGSQHAPDEATREAIAEQLRLGEEIRRKVNSLAGPSESSDNDSSDENSSDEERRDVRAAGKVKSAAKEILNDASDDEPEKGLLSLPFMRRSMQKKKEEAKRFAQTLMDEDDGESKGGRGGNRKMTFGETKITRKEAAPEIPSASSDEDEDVEAKLERLSSKSQRSNALENNTLEVSLEEAQALDQGIKKRQTTVSMAGISVKTHSTVKGKESTEDSKIPSYISSKKFKGVKDGYIFTVGKHGLGYYRDSQDPEQQAVASDGTKSKELANVHLFSQQELIKKAFAGDDVVDEFKRSKMEEVEGELPNEEVLGQLPGWGTWANQTKEPAWVKVARERAESKKKAAAKARRDSNMEYVVISEKWDSKSAKYKTQSVPYPFNSKETYERSMRQPLGKEYNTIDSFRNLTRPSVVKDNGVIIQPLRYSKSVGKHNISHSMTDRPGIIEVQGGMAKKTRKL